MTLIGKFAIIFLIGNIYIDSFMVGQVRGIVLRAYIYICAFSYFMFFFFFFGTFSFHFFQHSTAGARLLRSFLVFDKPLVFWGGGKD